MHNKSGRWGGMCEVAAVQLRETEKVLDPQVRFSSCVYGVLYENVTQMLQMWIMSSSLSRQRLKGCQTGVVGMEVLFRNSVCCGSF